MEAALPVCGKGKRLQLAVVSVRQIGSCHRLVQNQPFVLYCGLDLSTHGTQILGRLLYGLRLGEGRLIDHGAAPAQVYHGRSHTVQCTGVLIGKCGNIVVILCGNFFHHTAVVQQVLHLACAVLAQFHIDIQRAAILIDLRLQAVDRIGSRRTFCDSKGHWILAELDLRTVYSEIVQRIKILLQQICCSGFMIQCLDVL